MALKRMAEFKRDDYSYESPDGDQWEITIIQTADRKYVEIRKGDEAQVQWDIEMLLDIADAVRAAMQKPIKRKPHQLQSPNIIDHRDKENDNPSPSETIQASVEESMEQNVDSIAPVQSFSPKQDLAQDLKERQSMPRGVPDPEKMIRRT